MPLLNIQTLLKTKTTRSSIKEYLTQFFPEEIIEQILEVLVLLDQAKNNEIHGVRIDHDLENFKKIQKQIETVYDDLKKTNPNFCQLAININNLILVLGPYCDRFDWRPWAWINNSTDIHDFDRFHVNTITIQARLIFDTRFRKWDPVIFDSKNCTYERLYESASR